MKTDREKRRRVRERVFGWGKLEKLLTFAKKKNNNFI